MDAFGVGVIVGVLIGIVPYLIGLSFKWVWHWGDHNYHQQFWWKEKGHYKNVWAGGKDIDFEDER